jgi:hypothetical protein
MKKKKLNREQKARLRASLTDTQRELRELIALLQSKLEGRRAS